MLIGCGCHCGEPGPSDVQSGSFRSESIASSDEESLASSIPGTPGMCGACYNLPAEWQVTFNSTWFNYAYPVRDHDCRAGLGGTFTLRPYGIATLSPGASVYLDPVAEEYCTVWKSDELAQFVGRRNQNGSVNSGCRNNDSNWARVELVSFTGFEGIGSCRTTYFALFLWWVRPFMFGPQQEGHCWEWTVPCLDGGNRRNCVRCFGAGISAPRGFQISYPLNNAYYSEWNTIGVCPG